ncbi:O-fucosyltransferase 23 [Ranunculus cassubicifolius]
MDVLSCKDVKFFNRYMACRCLSLLFIALVLRAIFLPIFPGFGQENSFDWVRSSSFGMQIENVVRKDKYLEVPQIVWGLNNQKIAFARACLTARMLNRTLLMPNLSNSLFYKEVEKLEPVSFEKVFKFEEFNSRCNGFVRLGELSEVSKKSKKYEVQKGSGRKWTAERDLVHLKELKEEAIDRIDVVRIVGKNPFLWQDHWPVKDYARVFECLVLVDEIQEEAEKVVSRIKEIGSKAKTMSGAIQIASTTPYVAVHMRIEIDWMIHCKKLEQRSNTTQICSSKEEIMNHVGKVVGFREPTVVYLAVADSLLEDGSILNGWKEGLLPFEKKKLGVWDIYKKYPYLIQSAIDYEVCLRADIFVGNSYSTFSSLVVLERTQKMIKMGVTSSCDRAVRWPSFAYNILGESGGPQKWMTNMSSSSLQDISYGSNHITC